MSADFCDLFYHLGCIGPFLVLRDKYYCRSFLFFYQHDLAQEFAQVINMQHGTLVINDWENWKLSGHPGQKRIVAAASFSIDHRGTDNDHLKAVVSHFPYRYIGLELGISIKIRGRRDRMRINHLFLSIRSRIPINDHG